MGSAENKSSDYLSDKKMFQDFVCSNGILKYSTEELMNWILEKRKRLAESEKDKNHLLQYIFALYPKFQEKYEYFIATEVIKINGNNFFWTYEDNCLAFYFGYIESVDKKRHWKELEKLFNVKNLAQKFKNPKSDEIKDKMVDYIF